MICLNCENKEFKEKKIKSEQSFKGQIFNVTAPAMVCVSCEFHQFNDEQANALRRATVDVYKQSKSLLTSIEVREYREALNMSQIDFAMHLGVGIASIKRWETYFVQDKSQDDLIRLRCDVSLAENNALKVAWAHDQPDSYNGNRKFDLDIFRNVVSKIIGLTSSPLFFFKAIFYIDFMHFKRFGTGITGMKYSCLEHGPIPKGYDQLLKYMIESGDLVKTDGHDFRSNIEFNEELFSTDELAVINYVYGLIKEKGKEYLLEKSHKEDVFKNCGYLETLDYEKAFTLKVS